jgi:hypothetical protein
MSNDEDSSYAAMTINERLYAAGLTGAFGAAARSRDRAEMIRILDQVDAPDAAYSADTILGDPERYGY